jgi:hypothetical protein
VEAIAFVNLHRPPSGFKVTKDRLMLLLGANVSGTLELKALLVLTFTTPHVLKALNKAMLPV